MTPVRVRFVGCGDAFASGGHFQSCFHVSGGAAPLLIDCGATTLVALKRERIDPASIGWVLVSHLHGDHFGGLPWLILDGQFAGRTQPLVIAGPPGTEPRLTQAFDALYPGAARAQRRFATEIVELTDRVPCDLGPAVVTPFQVIHGSGAPAYALRVEYGDRLIAYSGDTEWTDSLIDAAQGADLFVCECNQFDTRIPGHLDYVTLAEKRPRLDCRRLVITHMGQTMLAHLAEVDADLAADGMVVEL